MLQLLDGDSLVNILSFSQDVTFDYFSIKHSCKNLFAVCTGRESPLETPLSLHDYITSDQVSINDSLINFKNQIYTPRIISQIYINGTNETDQKVKISEFVKVLREVFGADLKKIGNSEFQILLNLPNNEHANNIDKCQIYDDLESFMDGLLHKNGSNIPHLTLKTPLRKSLRKQLKDWCEKEVNYIDTNNWTLNACRLTRKVILHVQILDNIEIEGEYFLNCSNLISIVVKHVNDLKIPRLIILNKSGNIPNANSIYTFDNLGFDQIRKLVIYYMLKDCLIEWMEKRANLDLHELLNQDELQSLQQVWRSSFQSSDGSEIRSSVVKYFTSYENILEWFPKLLLERKIPFQINNSDNVNGSSIVEHLSLVSFENMNDRMRVKLMEYFLETIYKNQMNIADEIRNDYYNKMGVHSIQGISIDVWNQSGLTFEFDTLHFGKRIVGMKRNVVQIPKFPSIELSGISHKKPSHMRVEMLNLAKIEKIDNWFLENICSKGLCCPISGTAILCSWISTYWCCYKSSNSFGSDFCNFMCRFEHRHCKSLEIEIFLMTFFREGREGIRNFFWNDEFQ